MSLASIPPSPLFGSSRPRLGNVFAVAVLLAAALLAPSVVDRAGGRREIPPRAARSGRITRSGREFDVTVQVAATTIRLRAGGVTSGAATTLARALSTTAAALSP
jgi:hypothetical protein